MRITPRIQVRKLSNKDPRSWSPFRDSVCPGSLSGCWAWRQGKVGEGGWAPSSPSDSSLCPNTAGSVACPLHKAIQKERPTLGRGFLKHARVLFLFVGRCEGQRRCGWIMDLSQCCTGALSCAPNAPSKINRIGINRMFSLKIHETP